MSGGHFSYSGYRIEDGLDEIANDPEVKKRFPKLSKVLLELGSVLSEIEHDIDWDLSGDTALTSDIEFEYEALTKLFNVISRRDFAKSTLMQ